MTYDQRLGFWTGKKTTRQTVWSNAENPRIWECDLASALNVFCEGRHSGPKLTQNRMHKLGKFAKANPIEAHGYVLALTIVKLAGTERFYCDCKLLASVTGHTTVEILRFIEFLIFLGFPKEVVPIYLPEKYYIGEWND